MLIAFLIVYILLLAQLTVIILLLCKIKKSMQHPETENPNQRETEKDTKDGAEIPPDSPDTPGEITKSAPEVAEMPLETELSRVTKAVNSYAKGMTEDDLPAIKKKLTTFFSDFSHKDYHRELNSKDYFHFLDISKDMDARVVVIGDIHCDYLSLAAILQKLSVSSYDYFGKAFFVFLGDYLDRGRSLFEPLLLLSDLKRILGDRMIMLKGNHESLGWSDERSALIPKVRPHESCDCLNSYFGKDVFLHQFAAFYNTLPVYVYLKTLDQNILLTHAAVPRDIFLDVIRFDENNGEMLFDSSLPKNTWLSERNRVLQDMIWGDPRSYDEKIQTDGRFEFGRKQFERWMTRNHLHLLLRSHEEAESGCVTFFDHKLFTIFSTGGKDNPQTGYTMVEPAFCILRNKSLSIENSFIYIVRKDNISFYYVNALSKMGYSDKQISKYNVNDEFMCDEKRARDIRLFFKSVTEHSDNEHYEE